MGAASELGEALVAGVVASGVSDSPVGGSRNASSNLSSCMGTGYLEGGLRKSRPPLPAFRKSCHCC